MNALTIKASSDFQRIAREGKKWAGSAFILQALRKETGTAFRFGLTASRKVGNAVMRNRAKRRLREMIRALCKDNTMVAWDIVLVAKTSAVGADFAAMQAELKEGLRVTGVIS